MQPISLPFAFSENEDMTPIPLPATAKDDPWWDRLAMDSWILGYLALILIIPIWFMPMILSTAVECLTVDVGLLVLGYAALRIGFALSKRDIASVQRGALLTWFVVVEFAIFMIIAVGRTDHVLVTYGLITSPAVLIILLQAHRMTRLIDHAGTALQSPGSQLSKNPL